jgi:ABC-2 type transport system permease protein
MNFMVFPLFLLSGALFPISNFPGWLQTLSLFNPLTYGVDGLRGSLIGISAFPLALDLLILAFCSVAALSLGAYLFEKSDVE